jgi:hypothetical protein
VRVVCHRAVIGHLGQDLFHLRGRKSAHHPVAAGAELSVESKDGMIIVNVTAVNAKNEPVPGSTPAVILLQGKTKTNLDKTMDGKKLAAGNYVMSVVSEGKTASILVTIK